MPHVLVVDDQNFARAATIVALRAHGYEAVGFESATAALAAAQESPFDLAIVDIYMPVMDGVQLIKALRQIAPNLPIIAVSGTTLPHSTHTALDYFRNLPALVNVVCLQKPFRPPALIKAIETAMSVAA